MASHYTLTVKDPRRSLHTAEQPFRFWWLGNDFRYDVLLRLSQDRVEGRCIPAAPNQPAHLIEGELSGGDYHLPNCRLRYRMVSAPPNGSDAAFEVETKRFMHNSASGNDDITFVGTWKNLHQGGRNSQACMLISERKGGHWNFFVEEDAVLHKG